MEWCKLYATFATDPKVIGLSDKAFRRYVEALCYSTLHETDGLVPMPDDRYARELEAARLLDEGHVIHNWPKFNPTKADLEERRAAARARVRAHRERSNALPNENNGRSNADVPTSTSLSTSVVASSRSLKNKESPEFVEFYESAYPRREHRGPARDAWPKALEKASAAVIIAGARRFAADPNREAGFTPHPSTWLNAEGWNDDPLPPRSAGKARSVQNILALADRTEAQ
jgi:hypothetical protein